MDPEEWEIDELFDDEARRLHAVAEAAWAVVGSVDGAWLLRGEDEVLAEWEEHAAPTWDGWKCLEVGTEEMAALLRALIALKKAGG